MSAGLLCELERARVLGENPAASGLWTKAPWGLRARFADGHLTDHDFWDALRRWLESVALPLDRSEAHFEPEHPRRAA